METLEARREKQDLLQAFKILKGQEPNKAEKILLKQRSRNGAMTLNSAEPWNITVQRPSLDIRKYSFTGQTTDAWTKLPSELKNPWTPCQNKKNTLKLYLSTGRSDRWQTGCELSRATNCEGSPRAEKDDSA